MPRKTTLLYITTGLFLALLAGQVLAADVNKGRVHYNRHCQGCHGSLGKPLLPGAPDFTRGEGLLKPNHDLVQVIRNGKGMMPGFGGRFEDEDLFDLIAYLRTLR